MAFKNSRQRKAFFAKMKDFSELSRCKNFRLDWSPTTTTPTFHRFYVRKKNAMANAKEVKINGGFAKVIKLKGTCKV